VSQSWTCDRCGVRESFSPGSAEPVEPDGWAEVDGQWRCLACRRAVVVDDAGAGSGAARRALAEFELLRDPSASDRAIAKRIKCATSAVTPIRARLRAAGLLDRRE
jgi:hypothetical protein